MGWSTPVGMRPRDVVDEKPHSVLHDMAKPPSGIHDEFDVVYDSSGDVHRCMQHFNKWRRCVRANPLSFDVTMVCKRWNEDYVECLNGTKKVYKQTQYHRIVVCVHVCSCVCDRQLYGKQRSAIGASTRCAKQRGI